MRQPESSCPPFHHRSAYEDNPASNAVSRRVGYEPDGVNREVRDGKPEILKRYRMTRERWERMQAANEELTGVPVELIGFEKFREHLDGSGLFI